MMYKYFITWGDVGEWTGCCEEVCWVASAFPFSGSPIWGLVTTFVYTGGGMSYTNT